MKFILFFVVFGTVMGDLSLEWDKFKRDYNKQYATAAEEIERKQIFIKNVNQIRSYQQTHPDATFTIGINHLADQRIEDLVSGPKRHFEPRSTLLKSSIEVQNLPESVDWRKKGVISPVHDEGQVGEIITAIVSTELVETLHAIETGNLIQGSIPRVFDCCPQPIDAFDCIKNLSGICRNTDYPTVLTTCEPNKCTPFTTFNKINRLTEKDENTMLTWIQESTLWAEIDALVGFAEYIGGIYDEPSCSQTDVDHVVQIVGYGIEKGIPYWICKNSWGANWGEQGYIRMVRGKNMCGIANVVVQVANTQASTTMPITSTQASTTTPTTSTQASTTTPTTSIPTTSTQSIGTNMFPGSALAILLCGAVFWKNYFLCLVSLGKDY